MEYQFHTIHCQSSNLYFIYGIWLTLYPALARPLAAVYNTNTLAWQLWFDCDFHFIKHELFDSFRSAIFGETVSLHMKASISKHFVVCAALCAFQSKRIPNTEPHSSISQCNREMNETGLHIVPLCQLPFVMKSADRSQFSLLLLHSYAEQSTADRQLGRLAIAARIWQRRIHVMPHATIIHKIKYVPDNWNKGRR